MDTVFNIKGKLYFSLIFSLSILVSEHLWAFVIQEKSPDCKTFSKVIKKEYETAPDGLLNLNNRFGEIRVETWDIPRVKLEISILVDANSEAEAQKTFDQIKVTFINSRSYTSAETAIVTNSNDWWRWSDEKQDDYAIHIKAWVPEKLRLRLKNKHGAVHLQDLYGNLDLDLRHGDFYAENLLAEAKIVIEDGYASIEKAEKLEAELKEAELELIHANYANITSRNSTITIANANQLVTNSRYDTYIIDEVYKLSNKGRYDNFQVVKASHVNFDSRFTELHLSHALKSVAINADSSMVFIESVGKSFSSIDLQGNFTTFDINLENGCQYQIDANANFAGIRYPRSLKITQENEAGNSHSIKGYVGPPNTGRVIKAKLVYGTLRVDHN
ncbi:MAG TPA: hypothetical protein PKA00_13990 [Saprospiraceae bacterium]|nr:hypothetical protein [Saprospiraceae bacterium]HMQ84022.1 hypothetical protein [Saprospiraceae bacterium]